MQQYSKIINKIKLIILFTFCISCSKKSEIESIFTTSTNEYWSYRDYCWNSKGNYYKYNQNGTCDKYALYIEKGFVLSNIDGDDEFIGSSWSIKNDSTFVFNHEEYKIEKISDEEILLSYYYYKIKDKKCFVRLIKWVDGPQGPKPLKPIKEK